MANRGPRRGRGPPPLPVPARPYPVRPRRVPASGAHRPCRRAPRTTVPTPRARPRPAPHMPRARKLSARCGSACSDRGGSDCASARAHTRCATPIANWFAWAWLSSTACSAPANALLTVWVATGSPVEGSWEISATRTVTWRRSPSRRSSGRTLSANSRGMLAWSVASNSSDEKPGGADAGWGLGASRSSVSASSRLRIAAIAVSTAASPSVGRSVSCAASAARRWAICSSTDGAGGVVSATSDLPKKRGLFEGDYGQGRVFSPNAGECTPTLCKHEGNAGLIVATFVAQRKSPLPSLSFCVAALNASSAKRSIPFVWSSDRS